jgi:hypothetical protein
VALERALRRFAVVVAIAAIANGCVRTWAPVVDATHISDDRVTVAHPDGSTEQLEHARACGPTLIGIPAPGSGRSCACATSCRIVDVTRDTVTVLRASHRPVSDYVALAFSIVGTLVIVAFVGLAAASGAGAPSGS